MQRPDEAAGMTALLECRAEFEITSDISRYRNGELWVSLLI